MNISGIFRYIPVLILVVFFSIAPFITPESTQAASEQILLNEILIGSEKASDSDEFVELYNPGTLSIDISGFRLRYQNSSGTENSLAVIKSGSCIPAHGYFLWANSHGVYAPLADLTTATTLTDNYTLLLYPPTSSGTTLIDTIAWGANSNYPTPTQQSLARDPSDQSWLPVLVSPTPTKSTGCPVPEPAPPPVKTEVHVRFNEIFANPAGDENTREFIELYNDDSLSADISGYSIRDASKTGLYTFPPGTLLISQEYLVLKRDVSKISLNNSNETLSLFDGAGTQIDAVHYEKTKENVSLNYTGSGWRGGTPTPGTVNILNSLPETKEKVPKQGYRGVAIAMSTRGQDADGDSLKYTWDFGDGHKSYKKETSHVYEENGTYQVTLTTSDGSDDVIETFTLKIKSFPEVDVRITSFVPNPKGKDSDGEYLIVENREKKSVNLKGFSIATGWKKLMNHPVRTDFIIAGKSKAKLTKDFSLFTLPNEKGKIELRGPGGKTLQKIQYNVAGGIKDDAIYKKEKGKRWEWQAAPKDQTERLILEQTDEQANDELTPPIPKSDTIEENTPITVPEPKKLSLLPLLNYGTGVTLPDTIELTFDDPSLATSPIIREHYAVTFAKAVLSDLNSTINSLQNGE